MATGRRAGRRVLGLLAGLCLLGLPSGAQVSLDLRARAAPPRTALSEVRLRIDESLVLVPVTVSDARDRLVTGLEKDRFRVFDDKVEQTVTHFAMEDAPLAVGLVFDTSASMGKKLRRSRAAAAAFFATANPEDEFFLVTFHDRPTLAAPLTSDPNQVLNQLMLTCSKGRTALLDAVVLALSELKKSNKPRKALLVVSDGGDNASRYTEAEVKSQVRESDVLIYGIGIYEAYGSGGRTPEETYGPTLLDELAEQTGGREFAVDNLKELPDVAAKIGNELRNRYMLGFSPTNVRRDGRYHRLQVKLAPPPGMKKLQAHWRLGYYAPTD
ncbi:MAG: VWA domain-containing protein [Acidobacteriia bacterium]|nr:VWA domain-containing protein [Terriglobia bacterium]